VQPEPEAPLQASPLKSCGNCGMAAGRASLKTHWSRTGGSVVREASAYPPPHLPAFLSAGHAKPRSDFADRVGMMPLRREDRQLCADLVKVQWVEESGNAHCDWAILEDISRSGACIEMDGPILPDTDVYLEFPNDSCRARVAHCKFDGVKYLVGIEFEQGYRWSRRKYKPRHLLQFQIREVTKD